MKDLFGEDREIEEPAETLDEFIAWMAERFVARSDMKADEAADYARQVWDGEPPAEFGDPDHDWSRSGANEIADTDMSYWEQE